MGRGVDGGRRRRCRRGPKPLLYHYFSNKSELYLAAVRSAAEELREATKPDPTLPVDVRLLKALRDIDWIDENLLAYRAVLQGGISADPDVQAIVEQLGADVAARLAEVFGLTESSPSTDRARGRAWLPRRRLPRLAHRTRPHQTPPGPPPRRFGQRCIARRERGITKTSPTAVIRRTTPRRPAESHLGRHTTRQCRSGHGSGSPVEQLELGRGAIRRRNWGEHGPFDFGALTALTAGPPTASPNSVVSSTDSNTNRPAPTIPVPGASQPKLVSTTPSAPKPGYEHRHTYWARRRRPRPGCRRGRPSRVCQSACRRGTCRPAPFGVAGSNRQDRPVTTLRPKVLSTSPVGVEVPAWSGCSPRVLPRQPGRRAVTALGVRVLRQ